MSERASVIVPTIGRPELLAQTLASIRSCRSAPGEILVVDQSKGSETARAVARSGLAQARIVKCDRRGIGAGINTGLHAAANEIVFIVHDDCTVDPDWIESGMQAMRDVPEGIASGQVLPAGPDPRAVPSCLVLDEPREYTGNIDPGVLYPSNMVCPRSEVLAIGGFDEVITPAAEDLDLCYRWLRAGRRIRHIPGMIVHHHDWRSTEELSAVYVGYYRGQGMFYAKHLRAGDMRMLRFIVNDIYSSARSLASRLVRGTPRWADPRRGILLGLPRGLWHGWRAFRPSP
jgi:O-antigen biosynthesis protein